MLQRGHTGDAQLSALVPLQVTALYNRSNCPDGPKEAYGVGGLGGLI